jgi:nucleotide-binding universal stress UspA family protein
VSSRRARLADLEGVTATAASGEPAQQLVRLAASVDLLILGPHARRPIDRLTSGRSAQRLADGVPCPSLVVCAAGPGASRAPG